MGYRTVVMYMEMGCFVLCVFGWILVCSTMPIESWTWSEVGRISLTTAHFFSNLWKDCVSDSTGISDCKRTPSMLALSWDIHMCRALVIISIILSFFGTVLVLVGMKCTKIGGSDIANARVTFAGGMNYLIGGACSMLAFSYFGYKIVAEFQDPTMRAKKFEIGVGVFVGWAGSTLLMVGGLMFSIFAGREGCHSSHKHYPTYHFPDLCPVVPRQQSLKYSGHTEISKSRISRTSIDSKASSISWITNITNTKATNAYV
ncbi:claudin-10-like [Mastacembelus armatus]|uniref:claudin-10-like n=1 Tax=Mastacembelus armatus TaxID=205130 RepID=UPI000E459F94|nr:claudin-10-like [Mastacembelus armatus]